MRQPDTPESEKKTSGDLEHPEIRPELRPELRRELRPEYRPDFRPEYIEFPEEQAINPLKYINILIKRRRLIIIGCLLTVIPVAVYLKMQPPIFKAWARVLPSRAEDMSSRLDASFGVNSGVRNDYLQQEATLAYYQELMFSSSFLESVAQKKYASTKNPDGLDLLAFYKIEGQSEAERLIKVTRLISTNLSINVPRPAPGRSRSANMISIGYSAPDPELAAAVVNTVVDELVSVNQATSNSKAKRNREFIEGRLKESKGLLDKAEAALANFTASNKNIVTPALEVELGRLKRNITVQEEVYITLQKQLELARIEEVEQMAVLEVLDRAKPPLLKSGPAVRKNVIMAGFLSLFMFCGLAFVLEYVHKLNPDEEETKVFFGYIRDFKTTVVRVIRFITFRSHKRSKNL